MEFKKISAYDLKENIFKLINKDWMLITAGERELFNTMTASWGAFGELWSKEVAICFIRPQRHTFNFMNKCKMFSLSFFDEKYRDALTICGSTSGRDTDKMEKSGLNPVFDGNHIYFKEAKLILKCEKIYTDDIDPSRFEVESIDKIYPNKDYHRMFIGEIIETISKL